MSFDKILVPMDFSNCAKNAFITALNIAKNCNSSIEVLTAAQVAQIHAVGSAVIVEPILNDYYQQMDDNFESLTKEIDPGDIEVTFSKSTATFRDAIFSYLETRSVDLIVIGTKSKHDILEHFLGSHSADVVGVSKIPVIVIPENSDIRTFDRIGLAIDYKHFEKPDVLAAVRDFASIFGSRLHILNISKFNEKLFIHDDQKVALSEFLKDLEQVFHTYSDQRDITEILMESIDEHQLDMLFMLPQDHTVLHRLLHPSKSKTMAMQIEVPLMTIHQ